MARLFRIGGFIALILLASGCLGWKLYAAWDQAIHEAEYRKRLAITAANVLDAGNSDDPDDALRIYGVNVVHTTAPFRRWFIGDGVYLGDGMVLTAAHVVGHWPFITQPRIFIAGHDLPASVIKEGSPDRVDIALLSVDQEQLPISLRLRREPLCKEPLKVGKNVLVVYPDHTVRSRIISALLIAPQFRSQYGSLINEVEGSGSGVFDADRKCLLGIISREVPKFLPEYEDGRIVMKSNAYAGYFVQASKIRGFLPSGIKF